ncbi:hypothetical protein RND71_005967 [Anisodus tanguticus]|uniref:Uncharacterized protein n=1 Tax=Anisodus tanguticus TaxID=243964 RepID=A0AAE1ST24_9SOLA|nr:hypothetical protein RND71_005967 [Anisodus tanguticus]
MILSHLVVNRVDNKGFMKFFQNLSLKSDKWLQHTYRNHTETPSNQRDLCFPGEQMGEIIATTGHEEAVLIAEIDYAVIHRTR